MIIIDPHQRFLKSNDEKSSPSLAMRFNFQNAEDRHYFDTYPDQFKPYTSIELGEGTGRIDLKYEFNGTLFRFPLRNQKAAEFSELSHSYKPLEELIREDVVDSFLKDFHLILLFMRSIQVVYIIETLYGNLNSM